VLRMEGGRLLLERDRRTPLVRNLSRRR
jgi:hypothetical protein